MVSVKMLSVWIKYGLISLIKAFIYSVARDIVSEAMSWAIFYAAAAHLKLIEAEWRIYASVN